ncbi:MAG: hypothetical protein GEU93_00765 [Propionibacteriales bacterium]|nr:hypothetical protein [Propionibacteriales bacterium]
MALVITGCAQDDGGGTSAEEGGGEASSDFYDGETVTILVPAAPGGGADATAQFNSPYINEFVPGNPDVQVEHDESAGGIGGGNRYFNEMSPDGYTIFLSAFTTTMPWLVGESAVQYDVAELTPIAAFPYTGMFYVHPDTGIETVEDLPEHAGELVKGGVSPISTDLMFVLALEVLGVREDMQEIWGYGGTGDTVLAFQQGETNFDATTNVVWNQNQQMEEKGEAIPLVAFGFLQEDGTFERDPLLPDTPTVDEAHEMIYGEPPSGPAWEAFQDVMAVIHVAHSMTMHPDAPPDAVATLRSGLSDAIENSDYVEGWQELSPAEPIYEPEALDQAQQTVQDIPDESVEWIQNFVQENYPDEFTQ